MTNNLTKNPIFDGNSSGQTPAQNPALWQAYEIGIKSADYQFEWNSLGDVFEKVEEEKQEILQVLQEAQYSESLSAKKFDFLKATRLEIFQALTKVDEIQKNHLEEELGDCFFSLAQVARFLGFNPEIALHKANLKFNLRFEKMLQASGIDQPAFAMLPLEEKERLWQSIKS